MFYILFLLYRYGFRYPPQLDIALRPCFGGQTLGKYERTLSTVMQHLVKRLKQEIMKVLVYPNLDDEVLPFLNHIQYSLGGAAAGQDSPTKSKLTSTTSVDGVNNHEATVVASANGANTSAEDS